jgi:hypothetical protein
MELQGYIHTSGSRKYILLVGGFLEHGIAVEWDEMPVSTD